MKVLSSTVLAGAFGLLFAGCGGSTSEESVENETTESDEGEMTSNAVPDGDALYQAYCSICHGPEGEGYAADQANALSHPQFLSVATDAFLRHAIVKGRPGTTMSAWHEDAGGPMNDAEVDAVVNTIRNWESLPAESIHDYTPDGLAERAEDLYDIRCAGCHGIQGQDGLFMSISNPEFLASASDGYLHHSIAQGREEVGMPPFGPLLTPQQLDDLVVLIRSWQVEPDAAPEQLPVLDPDNMVLNPNGEAPAFTLDGEGRVSVKQVELAFDAGNRMILLDARLPSEYLYGHISGAVSIPFYAVGDFLSYFDPDTWVVAYCACPHAESGEAAKTLRDAGFEKVTVIDEGYDAWVDDGYPVTVGPNP